MVATLERPAHLRRHAQNAVPAPAVARTEPMADRFRITVPRELRAIASTEPDVWLLGDLDGLSHGRRGDRTSCQPSGRRIDGEFATDVYRAVRAAGQLGNVVRHRYASSSETASNHLPLVLSQPNNRWAIRYGLDGADEVIVDELGALLATARRRVRPVAVVLIAADHCYAPAVRELSYQGIATWLLRPRYAALSRELYQSATAVTNL